MTKPNPFQEFVDGPEFRLSSRVRVYEAPEPPRPRSDTAVGLILIMVGIVALWELFT